MTRVLLTGATGFLGMEVLVRLLERGDREVVCLVRAADAAAAEERLDRVLGTLYRDATPFRPRVKALLGDVTSPLGSPDAPIDVVCHCAASISFDLPLDEARAINVEGTRRVVEIAQATGARLVHVSTAYVAGAHRNTYEQTKFEAEQVVGATTDLEVAIARPSIVMGESDSGWTPAFNVLYWPLRAFARGLFDQVPALPDGRVDVVPVDYVADGIARLCDDSATGTFNLVSGADASTVDELSELACAHFGRPRPPYVQPGGSGGAGVDEHGAVYVPYFDMDIVFDDARTRELLGLRAPRMRTYFDALMDYADRARWGKRGTTREEAREPVAAPAR